MTRRGEKCLHKANGLRVVAMEEMARKTESESKTQGAEPRKGQELGLDPPEATKNRDPTTKITKEQSLHALGKLLGVQR